MTMTRRGSLDILAQRYEGRLDTFETHIIRGKILKKKLGNFEEIF